MLYPGLGSYRGALRWSQGGQLEQSFQAYAEEFDSIRERVAATPIESLRDDAMVMASARRVFDQKLCGFATVPTVRVRHRCFRV